MPVHFSLHCPECSFDILSAGVMVVGSPNEREDILNGAASSKSSRTGMEEEREVKEPKTVTAKQAIRQTIFRPNLIKRTVIVIAIAMV